MNIKTKQPKQRTGRGLQGNRYESKYSSSYHNCAAVKNPRNQ